LLAGTPSFADEMVKQILVERHADELSVVNGTNDFASDVIASAPNHGVVDRVYSEEGAADAG
jgi:hypothetical protein